MTDTTRRIGVPLLMAPALEEKTWGGRRLEQLGKHLPPGPIGESLESGPRAVVVGGVFDGVELGDLARRYPGPLLGNRGSEAARAFNDFPLLIKFIDASADLSVQVHPTDDTAPLGKRGKTEAWLIVDSEPGAELITGVIGEIDLDRIEQQIVRTSVRPGQVYFVPAGTVHAIGKGVLLYEIQQASDVTYRLYDWGRPREIHVDEGLRVTRPAQRVTRIEPLRLDDNREILVACRYFALERWTITGTQPLGRYSECFRVVTVLAGTMTIGGTRIDTGTTAIVPADFDGSTIEGHANILVGYIPDLESDLVQPLRAAGHAEDSIRAMCIGHAFVDG